MPPLQTISRDELLALARSLASDYGESLTLTAFRRETGLSQWAVFDLFGNWQNLRRALGLSPQAPRGRQRFNRDEILAAARALAAQFGDPLTLREFLRLTSFTARAVIDCCGGWTQLRQAVGLSPRASGQPRYTDAEMIEDMYGVYRRSRRRPLYHKHKFYGGRISPTAIQHRFGSWQYACECLKARLQEEYEAAIKIPWRWPAHLPIPDGYTIVGQHPAPDHPAPAPPSTPPSPPMAK